MVDIVIEELAKVLVVEPLDGLDFDAEAIGDLRHPMACLEWDLERDLAVEPEVPGAEDLAHPTPPIRFNTWYRIVRSSSAGPKGGNWFRTAGGMPDRCC